MSMRNLKAPSTASVVPVPVAPGGVTIVRR